ncbi:MAG: IS200/IS605 family transposase [Patescibacteria group bacterium]|nr:IS200/IS605 family transposase [Patescibacteria group bacterium]
MSTNYKRTSHTVYDNNYHLVWITKYRYQVLVGDIATRMVELTRQICQENNVEIIRGAIGDGNHVHIYVSIPPYISVSKVVQQVKGKTSRKIMQEYPELKKRYWGRHFWAVGYFSKTAGNVTDEEIKKYIESHGKDDKYGKFTINHE